MMLYDIFIFNSIKMSYNNNNNSITKTTLTFNENHSSKLQLEVLFNQLGSSGIYPIIYLILAI